MHRYIQFWDFELCMLPIIRCYPIPVDEEIAIKGARFRHERDWDLGDALIYATVIREDAKD
jgi:hypothetical protein